MLSKKLEMTLHRALAVANVRHHEYATLEHLLLALTEDEDAVHILDDRGVDISRLRENVARFLDHDLNSLKVPPAVDAKPTAGFQRVLQRAAIHVQSSGLSVVTGANVLVALFSERESHACFFLQESGITRIDAVRSLTTAMRKAEKERRRNRKPQSAKTSAVKLARAVEDAGRNAPDFRPVNGRLRYRASSAKKNPFTQRKAIAHDKCRELNGICGKRANEFPDLKRLVDRYLQCLLPLRRNGNAYGLHIVALDIEMLLKIKATLPPDPDRNPPLDGDIVFAAQSLLIAHAGFITLFPDIANLSRELDAYREQSASIDALRDKLLDRVLDKIIEAPRMLDESTLKITQEISATASHEAGNASKPTRAIVATKHSWVRGILSAIGRHFIANTRKMIEVARDSLVKEGVGIVVKNPVTFIGAVTTFLVTTREALLMLAEKLSPTFGWLASLFGQLGLL